jgi:tetratricopeptide (TPR) repeat protein
LRIITTTAVFLALALSATFIVAGTPAQNKSSKKKPRQVSNSSPAAGKLRVRRVGAKSASEQALPPSEQPPVSDSAKSPNEIMPAAAETKGEKEPGKPADSSASERPADTVGERPADAAPLPPAADTKGSNAPDNLTSLRDQIEATPNGSERVRLQLRLAEQLVAAGKRTDATKELRAIINANVFDPQVLYNAGNALARLGDSDEAINAYRKAIEQRKGNYSRALNNLGVILLRQGRWDEAHDALLSALKMESFHYAEASYNLGRLYSARGETDLAAREWRRTLSVDPAHQAAAQALSLVGPGRIVVRPEASAKAPKTPTDTTKMPRPSAGISEASPRLGKSSSSPNPASPKVLALDPVSYEFLQRARNLSERGKHQEAVENYQRLLSRSQGYFPPANLELSYALLALHRTDEAFANFLQVANRDGARYPMSYYNLARLYELKGNLTEAEESFAKAVMAYKTKNISFLLDLSRVRERRGNFKGALEAMEEYVTRMEQQGLRPSWADESLSALRLKATSEPK